MNPKFFGESHDIAKREVMRWLAPCHAWATHPMYFVAEGAPQYDEGFPVRYAAALGVDIVEGDTLDRKMLPEIAKACPKHLLLDPDTGLWWTPTGNSKAHVSIGEFAQITK